MSASGTVTVENGSYIITGSGCDFVTTAGFGSMITIPSLGLSAQIVRVIDDNTLWVSSKLRPPVGATLTGLSYAISLDFSPGLQLPAPRQNDVAKGDLMFRALEIIDRNMERFSGAETISPSTPAISQLDPTIAGTAAPGATVELDIGGVSRTTTAPLGSYSVDVPFLEDGEHEVAARYPSGPWSLPMPLVMPNPLKAALRAMLLDSTSGLVLDFAGTQGGLILAPGAPASQYLGPAMGATTFARASTATYFDKDGILRTAAANVPRFDYDPITKALRGLRLEGARTNQITNNTMVGGVSGTPGTAPTGWPAWAFSGDVQFTRTFGVEDGIPYLDLRLWGTPSGTVGYRLAPQVMSSVAVAAGESYTSSVFAGFKDLTAPPANCQWRLLWGSGGDAEVNGPGIPLTVIANGDLKNKRYSHTRTAVLAAPGTGVILRFGVTGGVYIDFTFRLALPQIEAGAHASSPILTSGAAVTRAADSCYLNTAGWLNDAEGTIVVDYTPEANNDFLSYSLMRTDTNGGLAQGSIYQQTSTSSSTLPSLRSYKGGASNLSVPLGSYASFSERCRIAASFKSGAMRGCRNGGAVAGTTSFTMPTGLERLWIGNRSGLGNPLFGWVSGLKYFPTALSDAQLQALTA